MKLLGRLIFLALWLPSAAWAHKFAPSLLSVVESVPDSYTVTFRTPAQTITKSPMEPIWPDGCSPVVLENSIRAGTGINTKWNLICNSPASSLVGKSFWRIRPCAQPGKRLFYVNPYRWNSLSSYVECGPSDIPDSGTPQR